MDENERCPVCASRRIQADYPPARGYALMLGGMALLFAGGFLDPAVLHPKLAPEMFWLVAIGALLALYGANWLVRHDNRFCQDCGYRFRRPLAAPADARTPAPGGVAGALMKATGFGVGESEEARAARRFVAPSSTPSTSPASERSATINPNTPVEPILACLKFRDPKQRETAAATLRKLTGRDFGTDHAAWAAWWEENKNDYTARRREKAD